MVERDLSINKVQNLRDFMEEKMTPPCKMKKKKRKDVVKLNKV
jgi:hypothetical protein